MKVMDLIEWEWQPNYIQLLSSSKLDTKKFFVFFRYFFYIIHAGKKNEDLLIYPSQLLFSFVFAETLSIFLHKFPCITLKFIRVFCDNSFNIGKLKGIQVYLCPFLCICGSTDVGILQNR